MATLSGKTSSTKSASTLNSVSKSGLRPRKSPKAQSWGFFLLYLPRGGRWTGRVGLGWDGCGVAELRSRGGSHYRMLKSGTPLPVRRVSRGYTLQNVGVWNTAASTVRACPALITESKLTTTRCNSQSLSQSHLPTSQYRHSQKPNKKALFTDCMSQKEGFFASCFSLGRRRSHRCRMRTMTYRAMHGAFSSPSLLQALRAQRT